jgi:hypothetical protein
MADEPPKRPVLSTIIGSRPASLAARAAVKAADPEPTTTTFFELFSTAIPPSEFACHPPSLKSPFRDDNLGRSSGARQVHGTWHMLDCG